MAASNYITKVAIVGTGGNSGRFMTTALLGTGKHTITGITRIDSSTTVPPGVFVKKVDYNNHESLVEALKGQDALIITLSGLAPREVSTQLINAAGEAEISWILLNEWSPDTANEALVKDVSVFEPKGAIRKAIADLGKSSYVAVSTGFWYNGVWRFRRHLGLSLKIGLLASSIRVGRAVAALLSLPIKSKGSNKETCLEALQNKVVYINSFTVSQKEMLDSVLRMTGTAEDDWTITKEPSYERYAHGLEEMKKGKRIGFAKMMYTRVFYLDGCGNFEHNKGTLNAMLGLPKEDIDQATERAIERSKAPGWTG